MLHIQKAVIEDAELLLSYIHKKAEFDGNMHGEPATVSTTLEKIKHTLFSDTPFATVLFARNDADETLGFALYHTRYSSFTGQPSIWMDDLFVNADFRSQGVGNELLKALKHIASNIDASHLSWHANVKNSRGQDFYNRFGAEVECAEGPVLVYRYQMQE